MAEKLVYSFGDGKAEGSVAMKNALGVRANLTDMCALGLPVPPGFTITTDACVAYYAAEKTSPKPSPIRSKPASKKLSASPTPQLWRC